MHMTNFSFQLRRFHCWGREGPDIPSGIGRQGEPRQSVLFPVGHSPTGADNKAYQQLPIRQEMNHVLSTS